MGGDISVPKLLVMLAEFFFRHSIIVVAILLHRIA